MGWEVLCKHWLLTRRGCGGPCLEGSLLSPLHQCPACSNTVPSAQMPVKCSLMIKLQLKLLPPFPQGQGLLAHPHPTAWPLLCNLTDLTTPCAEGLGDE